MKTVFISIACHVGANVVGLQDMSENREELESKKSEKSKGSAYKVFELTPTFASDVHTWFLNLGMAKEDAMRQIVKIGHIFDEAQDAGRKAKQEQTLDASGN